MSVEKTLEAYLRHHKDSLPSPERSRGIRLDHRGIYLKNCQECGIEISPKPHAVYKRFCSTTCSSRNWKARNPMAVKENYERLKNSPLRREYSLKKSFGMTIKQYDELFERQGKVCAICGIFERRKWHMPVDHCHITGEIRGILCANCNGGLGRFKDSIPNLKKAIHYLEQHKAL